jgi:3'-phosphoadenosine 5'-phosphosulfate sulfotransferase (PAPS reductase)/FAD synthetase
MKEREGDPFKIDGPTCIEFSGGRSSAYMLWRVLQSNGGLGWACNDDLEVIFANTGREAEATLEFVREVALRWHVPIRWVEYRPDDPGFEEVAFDTAARKGEPFEALIKKKQYLPNPVERFCTAELKVLAAEKLLRSLGWGEWDNMLGFRADEPLRVAKIRAKPIIETSPGVERCVPLADSGVSKAEVRDFWRRQPFDLALPIDYDGTTIDGNCDGCFLKSPFQRVSAMRRNPSMPVWWIRMEDMTGGTFTKDGHTYRSMANFAKNQQDIFDPDQEAIPCFCGD